MMELIPTGSQTIGPFFREAMQRPAWSDLTRDGARGEPMRIQGVVLDGDGEPVPDALLELWQPNADGRFAHPDDARDVPLDMRFRGFGRACTDPEGRYWFRTIVPGIVPAADGSQQAPHANLSVFARGLLKRLVTRIYLSDRDAENARDPLLRAIADDAARRSLIAQRAQQDGGIAIYRFDVVLQGAGETAFLAV